MAGGFIVAPYVQLFDENGDPMSGAFVYSYAAGTGTALPIYSDSTLQTPYSNPFQVDSAGRFAAYALNVPYKITVTKSDGTFVWTQDNYWIASPSGGGGGSAGGFPDWMTALVF